MLQEITANTSRTMNVNDQPPASQLTTENRVKHNARMDTGWVTMMQGQTKKYSFCFAPGICKRKRKIF
jgi:hypothetical protein